MYEDIHLLIKNGSNILFKNFNKRNYSSHIVHLILSRYEFTDSLAIIDHQKEIDFIQRTIKLKPLIKLYGYKNDREVLDALKEAHNDTNQQILICPPSKTDYSIPLEETFTNVINVFNKEDYELININRKDAEAQ